MFNISQPINLLQKEHDYSKTQEECQPQATPVEWNTH